MDRRSLNSARLAKLLLGLALLSLAACSGGGSGGAFMAPEAADASNAFAGEPALETDTAALDAALSCAPFEHPDKPPVLLVHGTGTMGPEQFPWNYIPLLAEQGFDVCTVTYPDRGLGDQQISAEYVVHALRTIHAETGRKVAMIGHSQGAGMPRWAIKWWASAREALEDFVLLAGPNHGTTVAAPADLPALLGLPPPPIGFTPEAFYQFSPDSNFVAAVNAGDETPGEVDYTSIYTLFDELVQPVNPVPTAALDWEMDNPRVSNILLQDICPGYLVDHVTIGTTDAVTFALALDAISNPGPADVERAGGASGLCGLLPIVPQENIGDFTVLGLLEALAAQGPDSIPDPHLAAQEPPLQPYAQGAIQ